MEGRRRRCARTRGCEVKGLLFEVFSLLRTSTSCRTPEIYPGSVITPHDIHRPHKSRGEGGRGGVVSSSMLGRASPTLRASCTPPSRGNEDWYSSYLVASPSSPCAVGGGVGVVGKLSSFSGVCAPDATRDMCERQLVRLAPDRAPMEICVQMTQVLILAPNFKSYGAIPNLTQHGRHRHDLPDAQGR